MQDTIYLAPMRGVTDAVYRNAFDANFNGIDVMMAPFISSVKSTRINPKLLKDILPVNNTTGTLIPQILSKSPEEFIILSQAIFDLGYKTVNWNLGCPYPMVAKKRRGSGLLPFPEEIDAFLEKVLLAIPNHLSVKVRLGRYHKEELFTLMPILNRYSLAEVIIHPRTGEQMYTGQVDLEAFRICTHHCIHPLVYNGDIISLESFQHLKHTFPSVSAWMIGRGILANPFLAEIIRSGQTQIADPLCRMRAFHDTLYEQYAQKLYGPSHLLNRMKGVWGYWVQTLEEGNNLLKQIRKAVTIKAYRRVVDAYFDHGGGWKME
jgi:tRNA-dihydrouridine synthase B